MRKLAATLVLLVIGSAVQAATQTAHDTQEQAIRDLFDRYSAAIAAKRLDAVMAVYAPDVVAFDAFPPRQYVGVAAYRKDYEGFFAAFPGPARSKASDVTIKVVGPLAYAYGVDHWTVTDAAGKVTEMTFRFTDVLVKDKGKWLIVHEHVSFPVDPTTGTADFTSKP